MIKVVCLESGDFSTMIKNENNIPVGYKDSAVGVIPQEWEVKTLGELVSITSGESPSSYVLSERGKYPFVKVEDMNNCIKFQNCSREYTNEEKHIVKRGSIIFPKRGAAISNNKVRIAGCNMYMDSNMMAIFPNNTVDSVFLYYKITNEQLYRIADTSTIPQINNKHIIPYKICLPSFAEQRQIVNIIGTWDEAIEKQTKLIKALEKRKQALMQRLLSGLVRLPGFTRKWETVRLGEIGKFESGCVFSENEQGGKIGIPFYKVSDMNLYGNETHMTTANNYVTYEQISRLKLNVITEESIIFAKVGAAISLERKRHAKKFIIDNNMLAFIPNQNISYMKYWFDNTSLSKYIQVGALPSYNASDLAVIKLNLPPLEEQIAIANILVSADDEIKRHNTKLSQLRKQKRGLMQQLLTGKKRVRL